MPCKTGNFVDGVKRHRCPYAELSPVRTAGRGILQGLSAVRLYRFNRLGRRGDHMTRRDLIMLFGSTTVVWPLAVRSQQPANVPVVGWLVFEAAEGGLDGFRQGLRELGYVERQNIAIEARSPEGNSDRLAEQIEELARLKVKIILTGGVPATLAAKRAALPMPVVFIMADPVGSGVVASLAHPGGNMTGQSLAIEEQFAGKWLELLKEAAPRLSRVAYLWNPANHSSASSWKAMQGLAPILRLTLHSVELRDRKDIDEGFAAIIRDHAEGVIVDSDPVNGTNQTCIVEFAAANRLPAIYVWRRYADTGGLMSYGPSFYELWRRAATYVDKILKGAKPADLPVEQPTKFELVVNLKTAQSLGLTIPQSILLRADEVIE
jgi:putative tryptophan/tyrosine transport system substrate-binding protein